VSTAGKRGQEEDRGGRDRDGRKERTDKGEEIADEWKVRR
jgi:hypothetical protein